MCYLFSVRTITLKYLPVRYVFKCLSVYLHLKDGRDSHGSSTFITNCKVSVLSVVKQINFVILFQ